MAKDFFISDKSERLKFFRSLVNDPKLRQEKMQCLVFGKKTVAETSDIEAFITIDLHKDDLLFQGKDRYIISEKAFKDLSGLVNPEPFAAVVSLPHHKIAPKIHKGILILDEINDPGNMGTIFRTAYGLGLDGIVVIKNSVDPYHAKVLRASKACTLKMPWIMLERSQIENFLKPYQIPLYSADLSGKDLTLIKSSSPFALILGNESLGVSSELKHISEAVHIPQNHLESYNVAIACAIISYTLMPKS